jgi:hypothetical protein
VIDASSTVILRDIEECELVEGSGRGRWG